MAYGLFRRLRESVSASAEPALQRGGSHDDGWDDHEKYRESAPTQAERDTAAKNGDAFSDGSYPITSQHQADSAWDLRNNSKTHSEASVVAHVRKQVKKHGLTMPGSQTKESVSLHSLIREASLKQTEPGVYEATIIREGAGNPDDANYYTKEALREAVSSGKFEGLRAYLNHPTQAEERERPERDVRHLAGQFREARYVDGTPAEVRAKFVPGGMQVEQVKKLIESAIASPEHRPLVGISIDGYGATPDKQTIDGRTYNMVREIAHLGSADIVTQTATGGRFRRRLQEALKQAGPYVRPESSQEAPMKPADYQQRVKAAFAKLSEAAGLTDEKDAEKAETLTGEAFTTLREVAGADLEPEVKIQEKIIEKPVAASDGEADKLKADLETTQTKLQESETGRKSAEEERDTLRSGQLAVKVLREKDVPEALREVWFADVASQDTEEAMGRFVDKKLKEREITLAEFRESIGGVEGAGARQPALTGAPSSGGLLEAMGIDRDELDA